MIAFLKAWWETYLIELSIPDWILVFLSAFVAVLFFLMGAAGVFAIFLRISNLRTEARWKRLEKAWEPKMLEILAGSLSPTALWREIPAVDRMYFVEFLMRYARRLKGRERETLGALAQPLLPPVAERTGDPDPARRARAVYTLGVLGMRMYEQYVVDALDDPSPLVALVAGHALARRDRPEHAALVLSRLQRFRNLSPNYLISLLASIGPKAAPPLRGVLADAARPVRERAIAADVLRHLHDVGSARVAEAALREDDRNLLSAVLRLVRAIGGPGHLPSVRRLTLSKDFAIRAHAVHALGRLGGAEDLERMRRAFLDPSPWVALQAARMLKQRGQSAFLRAAAAQVHPRAVLARQVLAEREA